MPRGNVTKTVWSKKKQSVKLLKTVASGKKGIPKRVLAQWVANSVMRRRGTAIKHVNLLKGDVRVIPSIKRKRTGIE
ncbi:MAG: hypothetical protein NTY48_03755 [Candidatus Diapherotrites archaeon]|nr:hypothetical protein [Candidatus Diapherotrites archaeon]